MSVAHTFDYIKRLEQAGYSYQQAEAHVEVLSSLTQDITMQCVTKTELEHLEKDITHQIEKTENRLKYEIDKLDLRIVGVEKRIDGVEKRIDTLSANMKWLAGVSLTYLTVLITVVQFIKH